MKKHTRSQHDQKNRNTSWEKLQKLEHWLPGISNTGQKTLKIFGNNDWLKTYFWRQTLTSHFLQATGFSSYRYLIVALFTAFSHLNKSKRIFFQLNFTFIHFWRCCRAKDLSNRSCLRWLVRLKLIWLEQQKT